MDLMNFGGFMRRMRRSTQKRWLRLSVFFSALLLLLGLSFAGVFSGEDRYLSQTLAYADAPLAAKTELVVAPIEVDSGLHFAFSDIYWEGETAYVNVSNGRKARLTLDKSLQESIESSLAAHPIPHAGAVAIEATTGRVLALVSSSSDAPRVADYALRALAPAASVFKLITSAALLESGRIDPMARVCYSGGQSMLSESDVRGNALADRNCANLESAIAHSINAVIARLAYQHLGKEDLEAISNKFGFNREIPFEIAVDVSLANFVDDDIERAKTAAGFWHVNLSPFHGALLAAAISNHGIMMRPSLVAAIIDADGQTVYQHEPKPWLVSMSAENADTLAKMSEATPREGSARKAFAGRKGWRKGVRTGGKTGTLSNKRPFYTYNWYVGWGQEKSDNIAIGSLVVNSEKWWIKGTHVAARAMGTYFRAAN